MNEYEKQQGPKHETEIECCLLFRRLRVNFDDAINAFDRECVRAAITNRH